MNTTDDPRVPALGAVVEWDTWCGPSSRHVVTHVDRFHVTLQRIGAAWIEPLHGIDATCFTTLGEACAHLRTVA